MLGFGHSRGGRRAYRGTIDSPRGESIFATGVPKSIIWHALARQFHNRYLQKTFCNYASVLTRHRSNDYVTDHVPSINLFFLRMLDDLSAILDKAGGWSDD